MSDDTAELREIPFLNGRYFATSDGRIWSKRRKRFRSPSLQITGYKTVTIRDEITKKTVTMLVHRLVAAAWIPNPAKAPQINHKDGDKTNNDVTNLEWCDGSHNMKHAWRIGLQPVTAAMQESARRCARSGGLKRRKLTAEMIEAARTRVACGEQQKDISLEYGVSQACLSMHLSGKTYTGSNETKKEEAA